MRARNIILSGAALLSLGFIPHQGAAPAKWAIVVGINDYTNFGDEIGGDLYGAVNDAESVRDVLVARWGYAPDAIKLLLDGAATRDAIEEAFTVWAPSVVRPGDQLLFFFAGHGSQMWDTDGDEEDGLDETFCPVDVIKGSTEKDISDDELGRWLDAIPTDDIVVIWDKCHAATSTRAVTPFSRPRSLDRTVTRDVPRPAGASAEVTPGAAGEVLSGAPAKAVLELAASGADEVAVDALFQSEAGDIYGGAFTYYLVGNLWRMPPGSSYREVFQATREELKRERFAQTPEINGPRGGEAVFRSGDETAAASVPVLSVHGAEVALGGGAIAGLRVGSLYDAAGARLRVTGVEGARASAVVERGSVAAGAAARLTAVSMPRPALRVSVAGLAEGTRAAMARAAASVPGLVLVSGAREFAHLIVRPAESGWVVLGLDGATRHQVAAGPEGERRMAHLLAQEAGAHQLAALENPAAPFPLEFTFEGGASRFAVGDPVAFRIRSGRDGYLTVVDLGTDGTVSVIYPNEIVRDARVRAGQLVSVPTRDMDVVFQAQEPLGRGIVRAFVTEEPLALPFTMGDATDAAKVAGALRAAAGAGVDGPVPVAGWASASLVYEIGR
ncbi:MAG TPA: caspase family protein [Longimicrobiales bacterium]|nr:caspase family protein [Longimicrobiales bacterium]